MSPPPNSNFDRGSVVQLDPFFTFFLEFLPQKIQSGLKRYFSLDGARLGQEVEHPASGGSSDVLSLLRLPVKR